MASPRIDLRPGVTELDVLMFSRREVEASDPSASVARLKTLFDTPEAIWRYRGQVALVVDGYNDDPRELIDTPKVRRRCHPPCKIPVGWPPHIWPDDCPQLVDIQREFSPLSS